MKYLLLLTLMAFLLISCSKDDNMKQVIDKQTITKAVNSLAEKYGTTEKARIERGVTQVAELWKAEDGSKKDFITFCTDNFAVSDTLDMVFTKLQTHFEVIFGHFNKISLDLNKPLHLDIGDILPVDVMFGGYDPGANLTTDFFQNKIAFYCILNFPFFSLEEKENLGPKWSRKEWAYSRMGDLFTQRTPGGLLQKIAATTTASDTYIAEYNIFVGNLVDNQNKSYFPKDLKLISHWNLRDEIKSQYSKPDGLEPQKIIYEAMKRIITQEIPGNVINSKDLQWNPYQNKVYSLGKTMSFQPEPNTRYQHLLNNFLVRKAVDKYNPHYPTFIARKFEQEFELPQKQVEELFVKLVSSPTAKKVADLIKKRLGRDLQPFDIWYDGFKARSTISNEVLNETTQKRYSDRNAFAKDLPNILIKLGFSPDKAADIASKVEVDPSRGAGHAWGAQMKSEKAHLRTRIGKDGMNYKGYNIAVHEFGHNAEQTLTLQDVDYYMLSGVPNTAFTEAMAFIFQKRDLELLGLKENNPDKKHLLALDNFWMTYEIMGVSLVDMSVWKWLYEHPEANAEELKNAVVSIAKDIWNKYYAPVFGIKDQPILAIYSHMIDNPLYLSAYPIGHLIEYQVDKFCEGKNLAVEMTRMLVQGRLIPQEWMKSAVGERISIEPTIQAAEEALTNLK